MLGIVLIGGILQFPRLAVEFDGNGAQSLARGVVEIARKAHVFGAEHAGGITRFGQKFSRRNRLRIFFRLGKIYRNIYVSYAAFVRPFDILAYIGHTYVVVRLAQLEKPGGCVLNALIARNGVEFGNYLRGGGGDNAQHFRFEKQRFFGLDSARIHRVLNDGIDYLRLEIAVLFGNGRGIGQIEKIKQDIGNVNPVFRIHGDMIARICDQLAHFYSEFVFRQHKNNPRKIFNCRRPRHLYYKAYLSVLQEFYLITRANIFIPIYIFTNSRNMCYNLTNNEKR